MTAPLRQTRLLLTLLALASGVFVVRAQGLNSNLPSFELQRENRRIKVQQTALDKEGGIAITRGGSDCRKTENISFFFAPAPKRVQTTVNKTVIRSSIVLRHQPKAGGAKAQDNAILDFFGGTLGVDNRRGCPKGVKRDPKAQVTITEGRTTVKGSDLTYHNKSGVGDMKGPIHMQRRAKGDSPALTATSERLSFNVDTDTQTLAGEVKVISQGRTSNAETLELDEEKGLAVLKGKPAKSRTDQGEVRGRVIEYDINHNDVVVLEGVKGSFEIDLGAKDDNNAP